MLTDRELFLLDVTATLANGLAELEVQHPSDLAEAYEHIHAIQALIAMRSTRREHPMIFRLVKKVEG